jgi:hypothetical protein
MKKLIITLSVLSIISFFTFASIYNVNQDVQRVAKRTQTASKQQVSTYDYVITGKDSKGYYGHSLNDNTNIFLVQSNLPKGMTLNVSDSIRVSFPKNSYETITNVTKLKTIAETFIITSINNGQYKGENTHSGTDKNMIGFTQSDMKNAHSIHVGDTVTAIYKPLKGEDQFLYVN